MTLPYWHSRLLQRCSLCTWRVPCLLSLLLQPMPLCLPRPPLHPACPHKLSGHLSCLQSQWRRLCFHLVWLFSPCGAAEMSWNVWFFLTLHSLECLPTQLAVFCSLMLFLATQAFILNLSGFRLEPYFHLARRFPLRISSTLRTLFLCWWLASLHGPPRGLSESQVYTYPAAHWHPTMNSLPVSQLRCARRRSPCLGFLSPRTPCTPRGSVLHLRTHH